MVLHLNMQTGQCGQATAAMAESQILLKQCGQKMLVANGVMGPDM